MPNDVVDLILADHREVERLFDELKNKPESRPLLLPTLSSLLIAHSRAEEAEVYPVARDEAGIADEVAHSQEEHVEAEEILLKLRQTDPDSDEFESTLNELVDAVTHHVEEEESSVLPGIKSGLSDQRRAELADAFAEARADHLGEEPGEATREELETAAANEGISGRSQMSKNELHEAIKPDDA
jgi:hemerythrin superfamily protein